ncbi:DUF1403 family protein [Mesorhizobium sp. M2D.F.Ca.ET.185.01.1.1]|uniref:DUF1403 family protein n=2 Tax=Mesorhizobium TaxID=68287 RepID=UPI000FCBA95A|nr:MULTISPECIES: DUF1403 family protein [unclassified Mesorhizobium]TGP77266.1 DUF1403 family protein [bacterium M00.F.Ca.ET.227.01.1.1]TGP93059.1 DUF1403 family protein [bacterium M00.F.Ca.ET.222.01.1.1]TGP96605.1 DUF1403 family protein [bacterium M00.F.Ca.ET.221.01.1.1]TGT95985.1 DUF1403 family protein [bacterium M00.F.Ca.ET.163.01.1.1]TGU20764.1 DUF1403 family protein [bacterium M00.F.Ca.ET.156.01.1.1]TGU49817.1 DUF1403 family protein [bacterium M00.F.Ca.ET.146.01.1.1]TGV68682.1 DUF1403 f
MIRLDPATANPAPPPTVPAWVLAADGAMHDADAAFRAGAALASLDSLARAQPAWAGAWRQRLALKCAAASMRMAGRAEDEAALRDAWQLCPAGADPGPAGAIFGAWRQLALQPPAVSADRLAKVTEMLGLARDDEALADLCTEIEDVAGSQRPAPFAAAAIAAHVVAIRPDAELLAWWLADLVLAQSLRWPLPLPLLMTQAFGPAFRGEASGKRIRPGDKNFERAVCVALVQAAAEACRLASELSRRAEKLLAVAPKLRAKGAGDVIFLLLNEDAVAGSLTTKNLSRFAARRLFERLQQLEAVRELSGRPTFRLFGL